MTLENGKKNYLKKILISRGMFVHNESNLNENNKFLWLGFGWCGDFPMNFWSNNNMVLPEWYDVYF